MTDALEEIISSSSCQQARTRAELWTTIVSHAGVRSMVEVGVWKGEFSETLLRRCPEITTYYLVDPWRHLAAWNKPANVSQGQFDAIYAEALARTEFARERRRVLRGTTLEVIGRIPSHSLDYAYIDGDHTLRGITIDLLSVARTVRPGGLIGGDDFMPNIWQHGPEYEPTLVFPYVVHFAEATGSAVYALPHNQFVLQLPADGDHGFRFVDMTGRYRERALRDQFVAQTRSRSLRSPLRRLLGVR